MYYDFDLDLEEAKKTEEEVVKVLEANFNWKLKRFSQFKHYDLVFTEDGKTITVEVKEDFRVGETGNVAVEYRCDNKPSGITTTKADFVVYKLHLEDGSKAFYLFPTKDLRQVCWTEHKRIAIGVGDPSHPASCYLLDGVLFQRRGQLLGVFNG